MSDTLDDRADDRLGLDPIVDEAHKRFKRCEDWEAIARARWLSDWRFANGDSENNYQWDETLYGNRQANDQPALTINKVRQHNLMITNDAKQHKSSIKFRAVGDGADTKAAKVYEGVVRHIENISNADAQRGQAISFQVGAGLGFTRVMVDYEHDKTFDQEIYIRGVPDPSGVYLDPDAQELDGSDARFGFVFTDRPRDEALKEYPDVRLTPTNAVDDQAAVDWVREKTIRVCEYYTLEEREDELLGSPDGTVILRSQINARLKRAWGAEVEDKGGELKRRKVIRKQLMWYKIIGNSVVDEKECPGRSIPIVPWLGEVTIIDNQLDRKGHTRALKDAQRIYNYNRSAQVEFGALQSKSPWLADVKSIEGNETYWGTANTINHAVLPYKSVDDDGNKLEAPQRQEPPQQAPAFAEGAQAADHDMMVASGQYEAELGAPSNEQSGRAINERQRQGDRATYHFIDMQAMAIRREGAILLELIPEIYDTRRVKRVIGEDGSEGQVTVDPDGNDAVVVTQDAMLWNPRVGQYAVVSDVGPDYATQRQEAFDAIVQVLTKAPELIPRIGDLLFKSADFPLADQIAERLKPGLPPAVQEQITKLQENGANLQRLLSESMQSLTEERLKNKAKDQSAVIDAFDADTKRLSAMKDFLPLDQGTLTRMVSEAMRQAMQDNLGPAVMSAQPGLATLASGGDLPGATGAMPIRTPDVGQQAATPGGA